MIQSLYTAASAMAAEQTNIDIIADNIANINTDGFKKSRVEFKEALYQALSGTDAASSGKSVQRGHGIIVGIIRVIPEAGSALPAESAEKGATEISNVNLSEEMTGLMRAQRTYTLISRAVAEADNMEALANQLVARG